MNYVTRYCKAVHQQRCWSAKHSARYNSDCHDDDDDDDVDNYDDDNHDDNDNDRL